jgi:hypothetical protein
MMPTVRHVASGLDLENFRGDGFLSDWVYSVVLLLRKGIESWARYKIQNARNEQKHTRADEVWR